MTTFTEIVAAVVVHSSAVAMSHFGVTVQPPPQAVERVQPVSERVIARTPPHKTLKLTSCPARPDRDRLHLRKA